MQRRQPKTPKTTHTHTQLHSCVAVLESEEKKFMPFKISKVLSKRINYMHVQQAEAEASGKWVKAAPRNQTCNNTTTHHKRSTCKFSASQCVCVCWCCCAISCKDVAEEAAIAAAATSSPQCLSLSLSLTLSRLVCVCVRQCGINDANN